MRRYSTLLPLGKSKLKAQWGITIHLSCRWWSNAKIKNSGNIKGQWGCGEIKTLTHHWWECEIIVTLEKSLVVSLKTKKFTNKTEQFLGILSQQNEILCSCKNCLWMFTEAFF